MSVSLLTYTISTLTPPSAPRLSSDAISSQVVQRNSQRYPGQLPQAQALLQYSSGESATAAVTPGNPLIKAFDVASESVTITLSATAQKAIAQQNQALGQLRQLNEQLRTSNHDAAAARLQHLLQEFHALQQFGTASARALAALAKEISAAAADL
jgi:hypothetical protein